MNKGGITTSQFQQQVEYQEAVEGELDKTIEAINGVQAAVVHVVIPTDDVFAGSQNQPSASVLVEMVTGQSLSASQVQAVVHLVASSVENLAPENVTVTDQNGDVLAAPGVDSSALAGSSADQQQTSSFQDAESTSLQNMLASVLGPGMAVVHVAADLNFNQTQTSSKTYDRKPVAVSTSNSTETYTGSAPLAAAGTLGQTTTTVAAATGTAPGSPGSLYKTSQATQSNAVGEVDSTNVQAPGAINRLSVAVLLNSSVKASPATIQRIVSTAAGLNFKRGDTITVGTLSFNNSDAKAAAAQLAQATSGKKSSALMSMIRTGMILLVVALLVLYALRKLTKQVRTLSSSRSKSSSSMRPTTSCSPVTWPPWTGDPELEASRARAALSAADAAALGDMIDQDPAPIAELLREWPAEERT